MTARSLTHSLWTTVQGDATFVRRLNGWFTVFWIVMIPISLTLGWLDSVVCVWALSLWALVSGHWAAWQAARVEVEQQRQMKDERRDPLEERIVDKLVDETELQPSKSG